MARKGSEYSDEELTKMYRRARRRLAAAALFLVASLGIGLLVSVVLGGGGGGGRGAVAIPAPTGSAAGLIVVCFLLVASTPWIVAAVLSLCNITWAVWMHLILTYPTLYFGLLGLPLMFGIGNPLSARLIGGAMLLMSLHYCLIVWCSITVHILYRNRVTQPTKAKGK